MYLFAFGNRRQPCISVKHVLKCSNAICEWPELSISIKSVVLYCIVINSIIGSGIIGKCLIANFINSIIGSGIIG